MTAPQHLEQIPSMPGALQLQCCLTTSVTSSRETDVDPPSSSSSALSVEGGLVGFRSSSKCSLHCLITSSVEVSSVSPLLFTAWMVPCFALLWCWTVFQQHLGAKWKSLCMAFPNFSHTRCFASVTAGATILRVCQYLATAPRVPRDKITGKASFFSGMTSLTTGVHHDVRGFPLRYQWPWGANTQGCSGNRYSFLMLKHGVCYGQSLTSTEVQQWNPTQGLDQGGHSSQCLHQMPRVHWNFPVGHRSSLQEPLAGLNSESPEGRLLWTAVRCIGTDNSQNFPSYNPKIYGGNPLIHRDKLQRGCTQGGLVGNPTPAWHLTPWATLEKNRFQPLSRSLVPEPTLHVEVSPTRSNR